MQTAPLPEDKIPHGSDGSAEDTAIRGRQESLIKENEVGFLLHSHFHLNPFRDVTWSGWEFMYTAKMKPIWPGCWDKVNAFLILFMA